MKVELIGWSAQNLRGYLRDVEIDLSGDLKRWTLLQMPNGTGKTTTMALLRAAFSGQDISSDEIMSFRADDTVESGWFEVALLIDGTRHDIRLIFDFRRQSLRFQTRAPSETVGGLRESHWLPKLLRETLRDGVIELFVFDGELASKMISRNATRADQSIRALYRLDLFSDLSSLIKQQTEIRKRSARGTQVSTPARVAKLEAEVNEVAEALVRLERSEKVLREGITKLGAELKEIEDELSALAAGKEQFSAEQKEIEDDIIRLDSRIEDLGKNALRLFRSPPHLGPILHDRLQALGGTLERHKLPRSMSTEFFVQLANRASCICDTRITPQEKQAILKNAEDFLGQDEIAVINQMKSRLQDVTEEEEEFGTTAEQLRIAISDRQLANQRLDRLRERMKEAGVENVGPLQEREQKVSQKLVLEKEALSRLTQETGDDEFQDWRSNLAACRSKLKDRTRTLGTAEGTLSFRQKADKLSAIVTTAQRSALRRLRESVRLRTNTYLERILANEMISVSSIDGHLHLKGSAGEKKDSVSEGQKLAVSYAFLAALLADADHELPFIVDSPAVSLDVQLRRTVGELVPPLFGQMLMFVISSEREGFADTFFDKNDSRFMTISVDSVTGRTEVQEGLEAFQSFHAYHGGKR